MPLFVTVQRTTTFLVRPKEVTVSMWEETGKTQMNASEEELEESAAHVQIKHMDLFWIFKQRLSKEES